MSGGFIVGLTSVGSGTFFGLVMLLVFPLTASKVVGTDIFHAAALLWVAGAGHLVAGNVDLHGDRLAARRLDPRRAAREQHLGEAAGPRAPPRPRDDADAGGAEARRDARRRARDPGRVSAWSRCCSSAWASAASRDAGRRSRPTLASRTARARGGSGQQRIEDPPAPRTVLHDQPGLLKALERSEASTD